MPEITLIMLVSAFAGYQHTMNAYKVRSKIAIAFLAMAMPYFHTRRPKPITSDCLSDERVTNDNEIYLT